MKKELEEFESYMLNQGKQYQKILKKLVSTFETKRGINLLKLKNNSLENKIRSRIEEVSKRKFYSLLRDDCTNAQQKSISNIIIKASKLAAEEKYYRKYKEAIEAYNDFQKKEIQRNLHKWTGK